MKYLLKNIFYLIYKLISIVLGRYRLKRVTKQKTCKIIIGAGGFFQSGWISTEIEFLNILRDSHWKQYFLKNSIDSILAEHVWEHMTEEKGIEAAKKCFQYLKPRGYLRIAVPDGLNPNPNYIEWVRPRGSGLGAKEHMVLYTYRTIKEIFKSVGFKVDLLEYFDEKGEFHYKEWNPNDGMIRRSRRFDSRNKEGKLNYTSIILDAYKES